jgi:hypothetical protein
MCPGKAEYLNQFSLLSGYLRAFPEKELSLDAHEEMGQVIL